MAAVTESRAVPGPAGGLVMRQGGIAYWLSGALALAATVSSLLTFLMAGVLRGTPVMNGSARGTALVMLVAGAPVLVCAMLLARHGSAVALVTWLGAAAFLLYNAVMLVFGTPANQLFLLYVAVLSLAAWSVGTLLSQADVRSLARHFPPRVPVRGLAAYIWVIVALNAIAWLSRIVPDLAAGGAPAFLRGTGLPTSPVYVQDLALWLPLMAVAAAWLWRRGGWGYLLAGGGLVMWVLESLSIAIDQWYGHAADPASAVASGALVPAFAVLALIGLVPLYYLLRDIAGGPREPGGLLRGLAVPAARRRAWPSWALAVITLIAGVNAVYGFAGLLRNGFGMPVSWLNEAPFGGWTLPATALLIGVALPQLAALGLLAAGNRWALAGSYLAGVVMVAWIVIQLLVLQRYFFLQPVIAGLGAAEIVLAALWQHAAPSPARHRPAVQA